MSGIIGRHSGSFDDVASSADSEPVKWNANAIAVISRRNQKSQNLALIPAMPRREKRYGTKLTAVSMQKMLGMLGESVFVLRSELKLLHLRFNDALINWEKCETYCFNVQQDFLYLLFCLLFTDNFEPFFKCRIQSTFFLIIFEFLLLCRFLIFIKMLFVLTYKKKFISQHFY